MKKEIIINDHKWEFKKNELGYYDIYFYEYYEVCGFRCLDIDKNYTEESILNIQKNLLERGE